MADKTVFSCGENLDITQVAALQKRLFKSLERSSVVELKAADVTRADTAGLQLLAALSQEVKGTGGKITWVKPSSVLLNTAKRLGLTEPLGL